MGGSLHFEAEKQRQSLGKEAGQLVLSPNQDRPTRGALKEAQGALVVSLPAFQAEPVAARLLLPCWWSQIPVGVELFP